MACHFFCKYGTLYKTAKPFVCLFAFRLPYPFGKLMLSRMSIKSTTGGTRTRNPRLTRHFTQFEVHRLGGRCLIHWATVAVMKHGACGFMTARDRRVPFPHREAPLQLGRTRAPTEKPSFKFPRPQMQDRSGALEYASTSLKACMHPLYGFSQSGCSWQKEVYKEYSLPTVPTAAGI